MLHALIDGQKRPPVAKGERAQCPGCGTEVVAVLPIENMKHWRHKGGDCDAWSEPETEWHLNWKSLFTPDECEISLRDQETGELHRADVLCKSPSGQSTVLEFQHSPISVEEQLARQNFYGRQGRFFWMLNMHSDKTFRAFNFQLSWRWDRPIEYMGKTFHRMSWNTRSQFIDRWKAADAHVFLNLGRHIFYLATPRACGPIVQGLAKGEYLISELPLQGFVSSVRDISAREAFSQS